MIPFRETQLWDNGTEMRRPISLVRRMTESDCIFAQQVADKAM